VWIGLAAGLTGLLGGTMFAPARPAPHRQQLAYSARHERGPGYWLLGHDGGVFTYGSATFAGSAGGLRLAAPVVVMAASPTGRGYWLAAADGGVFTFGDPPFAGSAAPQHRPASVAVVGMAATPTGQGYWLAWSDGAISTFGDATFWGAPVPPATQKHPIVAMAGSPTGLGYWVASADGTVFGFGDARWWGDAAKVKLARPIVGIAASPAGGGYWLVAADGGVFAYGSAVFAGSAGGRPLRAPIVGLAATITGSGYWLVAADGGVFAYGDAPFLGSLGGLRLAAPVVAGVSTPRAHGTDVAAFFYPWYGTPQHDGAWRHWDEGGHTPPDDIGSDYYPTRGAYSSADPSLLDAQLAEIADAGIDEIVVSWWGRGSFEDTVLSTLLPVAARHSVAVAVHIEPYEGRTTVSVGADLSYLDGLGIDDVWLYEAAWLQAEELAPVLDQFSDIRVLGETGDVGAVRSGTFARWALRAHLRGIYTYDAIHYEGADLVAVCGSARLLGLDCVPAVAPGYSALRATGYTGGRDRADGATFDLRFMGVLGIKTDEVAITSYNEWHEGTQIEPAVAKCLPGGFCYADYEGAYQLSGAPASGAYMGRAKTWVARYRIGAP